MTRVVQIRRGTTAQNDNFTGMIGEVTYDTDAKTLRVHDGATLGGFALARADQIPSTPDTFDIDSVPDTKWAEIVARVAPTPISVHTSNAIPVMNTTFVHHVFDDVHCMPYMARAVLVCQNASAGYAAGDEVSAFGIGAYSSPIFNIYLGDDGVHVRMAIGNSLFWVAHNTTGEKTDIVNGDWQLKIRIYC